MSVAMTTYKNFIRGTWVESQTGNTFSVENPATREIIGHVPDMSATEVEDAILAAHEAFPGWAALTAKKRSTYMYQIYEEMMKRKNDIAKILTAEQGKPFKEALGEVIGAADFMLWYAEEAKRVYGETIPSAAPNKRLLAIKQPVGVVAAITPWNFPASMITRKIAPALAAGCTVVIKPAEQTPLTAIAMFQAIEAAGLPAGVANLVTGDPLVIGPVLNTHPLVNKITFTGSTEVGKLLYKNAADTVKRISLELGGHAPYIIFEDANLDKAAQGLINAKFRNNGQVCICPNRVYVQRSVAEQFAEKLAGEVAKLRLGNGLTEDVEVGPMIDEQGISKVEMHVGDAVAKGATIVCGGARLTGETYDKGYFFAPTILMNTTDDMIIAKEETFGPVAPLFIFDTEEEVLARANDSKYGLASYAFTNDLARSIRLYEKLQYGIVGINDPVPAQTQAPFGGFKESGLGREGGHFGMEAFLETKFVSIGM